MTTPTDADQPFRLLLTAGPTHEPIDAVRYIGNRSSGRLGCAVADAAAARGWDVRLLLGPTRLEPADPRVHVERFTTVADLERLLIRRLPGCDLLVMAAAVADYRPAADQTDPGGKLRRTPGDLVLRLEPTPDLVAGCVSRRREDQLIVGFALEPAESLLASAKSKIERKGVDAIVANPLETMDAEGIEARLIGAPGTPIEAGISTPGKIAKTEFADWLVDRLAELLDDRHPAAARTQDADA